jgi:hypothetical protein
VPSAGQIALVAAVIGLSLVGCSSDDGRVKLYPVSGQVLVGDLPAEGLRVRFYNASAPNDIDAPQPFGTTDATGKFEMGTFEEKDGAPAGEYLVVLLWPDGPPGPGIPRDRLGNAFTDLSKTPYRAKVPEGGTVLDPIKVDASKVKKLAPRPDVDPTNPNAPGTY